MIDKKIKEELKGLRCLYSVAQQTHKEDQEVIEKQKKEVQTYKEMVYNYGMATTSRTDELRIERLKREHDKQIDKLRESLRERDSLLTDKRRLESELRNYKDKSNIKYGFRTQKRTITKERLEDLIKQYYNFETVRIGKILVGTQTPTLYPGSSKLELDIQYTKEDKE